MARSRSKTGSDLGSYWTENVTWPLRCPYSVPVTLLPREDDPPVTSEISWLETPEDGGEGRARNLQAGMLMTLLMRERKKEESFKWSFPILIEEEDEEEEAGLRETDEHLRQETTKSSFSGMVGIKAEEEGERAWKLRAGEVVGLIFLVLQLKLL